MPDRKRTKEGGEERTQMKNGGTSNEIGKPAQLSYLVRSSNVLDMSDPDTLQDTHSHFLCKKNRY